MPALSLWAACSPSLPIQARRSLLMPVRQLTPHRLWHSGHSCGQTCTHTASHVCTKDSNFHFTEKWVVSQSTSMNNAPRWLGMLISCQGKEESVTSTKEFQRFQKISSSSTQGRHTSARDQATASNSTRSLACFPRGWYQWWIHRGVKGIFSICLFVWGKVWTSTFSDHLTGMDGLQHNCDTLEISLFHDICVCCSTPLW